MPDPQVLPPAKGGPKPVPAILDWSLLLLPGLVWGASFLFIAESLPYVPPDGVVFTRLVIGFITLSFFAGVRRPVPREDWKGIGLLGLLWFAFPMTLFPHAQLHVTSALAGMLNGVAPLIAVVAGILTTRIWPTRGVVVGLLVGFSGAVLMGLPGFREGGNQASGITLIVIAMCSYGAALNISGPLQRRNGALPIVWRALAIAIVLTAPLGVPALLHSHWSWKAALSLLALGMFGTALANIAMAVAAGRFGVARAAATTFLIPVVSLLLGVLVRDEKVAALSLAGIVPCLAGAWLIRRATLGRAM